MTPKEKNRMLNTIISKTDSIYGKLAKRYDLSFNALMVLVAMDAIENPTQKKVADIMTQPKQTVNSILTNFKNKGYVTYEPDKNDKREKIIKLTIKGAEFSGLVLEKIYSIEERAITKMGEEMSDMLIKSKEAYYEALKQEVDNEEKIKRI